MSRLSISDIQNIAELARIGLKPEEQSKMVLELNSIIEFVDTISKTNTKGVEPTSQITGLVDVWREDEIRVCPLSRDELLKNAPMLEKGYIKVKRVM